MKKALLFLAFAAISQVSFAQAKDPAMKKQAVEIIKQTGSASVVAMAKQQILPMIAKEKQAAFLVEFEASLPALYDKIADVYVELYTKEDLDAIQKFYDSPIGKKMTANTEILTTRSQTASTEWAQGLQAMVMKYMN